MSYKDSEAKKVEFGENQRQLIIFETRLSFATVVSHTKQKLKVGFLELARIRAPWRVCFPFLQCPDPSGVRSRRSQ